MPILFGGQWNRKAPFSVLALALLLFSSCSRDSVAPLTPVPPSAESGAGPNEAMMQRISYGFALALADQSLRVQLLEDFRDSPFPQHSLQLSAYSSGGRGHALAVAVARGLEMEVGEYLALLRKLPEFEIAVSSSVDRALWQGSDDVVVVATTSSRSQLLARHSISGFDTRGNRVEVPLTEKGPFPVISILPARVDFGTNPEARRGLTPKRAGMSISTMQEEFGMDECNELVAVIECLDEGGSGLNMYWQAGVHAGPECTASTYKQIVTPAHDEDRDTIKDVCESIFAVNFQPSLVFHTSESHSAREPYWAVKRNNDVVSIMYLLAYYYDGGAGSHHGDSEFIILRVAPTTGDHWTIRQITTSSHWGVCCGMDWTETTDASLFGYDRAHPFVYVSNGKHANYRDRVECDSRIGDTCSERAGSNVSPVGVRVTDNIGNRWYPFDIDPYLTGWPRDCTRAQRQPRPGIECFYSLNMLISHFGGWSGYYGSGATHYRTMLDAYGF